MHSTVILHISGITYLTEAYWAFISRTSSSNRSIAPFFCPINTTHICTVILCASILQSFYVQSHAKLITSIFMYNLSSSLLLSTQVPRRSDLGTLTTQLSRHLMLTRPLGVVATDAPREAPGCLAGAFFIDFFKALNFKFQHVSCGNYCCLNVLYPKKL